MGSNLSHPDDETITGNNPNVNNKTKWHKIVLSVDVVEQYSRIQELNVKREKSKPSLNVQYKSQIFIVVYTCM